MSPRRSSRCSHATEITRLDPDVPDCVDAAWLHPAGRPRLRACCEYAVRCTSGPTRNRRYPLLGMAARFVVCPTSVVRIGLCCRLGELVGSRGAVSRRWLTSAGRAAGTWDRRCRARAVWCRRKGQSFPVAGGQECSGSSGLTHSAYELSYGSSSRQIPVHPQNGKNFLAKLGRA